MLQVVLFSVFTISFAFTTHDIYPVWNSNGRRPVHTYEYPKRYDGAVTSDMFDQGVVFPSDGDRRRVDVPYSYQYPYQWSNRQVPWNRVAVTEPTKFFNIFKNFHPNTNVYTVAHSRQPVVTQENDLAVNQMSEADKLNKTQEDENVPEISTQSYDVSRTLVINEQQVTWNNEHDSSNGANANISTRSIISGNHSNSIETPEQAADKSYRTRKTNSTTVTHQFNVNTNNISYNNKVRSKPNNTANRFNDINSTNNSRYSTETTQNSEVTPSVHEQTTENITPLRQSGKKDLDDDRWVWSNAEVQKVESTTLFGLDDRAAFSADACPIGKIKIGGKCIVPD